MCVETKLDRFLGILLSGQLPPIIRPIVGLLLILPFRIQSVRVIMKDKEIAHQSAEYVADQFHSLTV